MENNNNNKLRRDKQKIKNLVSSSRNNKTLRKSSELPTSQSVMVINKSKNKSMTSMVMKSLLYLLLLLVFAGLVFMVNKTIKTYKNRNHIENEGDVVIIDDWVSGMSSEFESDVSIPQLLSGNNYSFSFMIYLNQPSENNRTTKQVIFKKGSDLELFIPPLQENDNRNILKLVFSLENPQMINDDEYLKNPSLVKPSSNKMDIVTNSQQSLLSPLKNVIVSIDETTTQDVSETSQKIIKSSFTNLSNNQVNYQTVQHIHPKEKFDIIQNDNFMNTINPELDEISVNANPMNMIETIINDNEQDHETICINKEYLINKDYVEIHNIPNAKVNHITVSIHNNIVDIYNNGKLESSKLLTNIPVISGVPFNFFEESGLNGFIKKFRFYNRGLNQDDVEKYYIKDAKKSNKNTLF